MEERSSTLQIDPEANFAIKVEDVDFIWEGPPPANIPKKELAAIAKKAVKDRKLRSMGSRRKFWTRSRMQGLRGESSVWIFKQHMERQIEGRASERRRTKYTPSQMRFLIEVSQFQARGS